MNEGRRNLAKYHYKVDYVLTHCCSTSVQETLDQRPGHILKPDILTDYLQEMEEKLAYRHWFFGHYHMDQDVDEKHSVLYHTIVPIEDHEPLEKVPRTIL